MKLEEIKKDLEEEKKKLWLVLLHQCNPMPPWCNYILINWKFFIHHSPRDMGFVLIKMNWMYNLQSLHTCMCLCVCVCMCVCACACVHVYMWGQGVCYFVFVLLNTAVQRSLFISAEKAAGF